MVTDLTPWLSHLHGVLTAHCVDLNWKTGARFEMTFSTPVIELRAKCPLGLCHRPVTPLKYDPNPLQFQTLAPSLATSGNSLSIVQTPSTFHLFPDDNENTPVVKRAHRPLSHISQMILFVARPLPARPIFLFKTLLY